MLRYDEKASNSKFSSRYFGNLIATTLHINDNIKKARILRGFTQDEISSKLGEKRSTYAEWEKDTIPRADIFWNIASVLGFSPGDLMKEKWEPDESPARAPTNGIEKERASLDTIQKAIDNVLHHQVLTRAEVRAYGQYPVGRDAKGDQNQIARILGEIGMLVAEHEAKILKEGTSAGAGR